MYNDGWKELHQLVVAVSEALFVSNGLPAKYVGTIPHHEVKWDQTISIIGLAGAKLRGSLVLSIPSSLLLRSHPAGGTDPADLADWIAELANLLLGRLKARLLVHQVSIALSIPITVSGTDSRSLRFSSTPVVHQFDVDGQKLQVAFEAVSTEEADLITPGVGGAALAEGEMVTF